MELWKKAKTVDQVFELVPLSSKFDVLTYFANSKAKGTFEMFKQLINSDYYTDRELSNYPRFNKGFSDWSKGAKELFFAYSTMRGMDVSDKTTAYAKKRQKLCEIIETTKNQDLVDDMVKVVDLKYFIKRYGGVNLDNYPEVIKKYFELDYITPTITNVVVKNEIQETDWRKATDIWTAINLIPEEERWSAFEYFLENNARFAKSFVWQFSEYSLSKVYNRYKNMDLSHMSDGARKTLGEIVNPYIDTLEEKRANSLAQRESKKFMEFLQSPLVDEYGYLKQFFTLGNGELIQSSNDYITIIETFVNSQLSMEAFCRKYKISSIEGFRSMLDAFVAEIPELGECVKGKLEGSRKQFISSTLSFAEELLKDDANIGELIKNNKSVDRTFGFIVGLADHVLSFEDKLKIARKITAYYADKISRNDNSRSLENINNYLTEKELLFIVGYKTLSNMKRGVVIDIGNIYRSIMVPYRNILDKNPDQTYNRNSVGVVAGGLKKYENRFIRSRYMKNEIGLGDKYGNSVLITSDIVDMAQHYAKTHGLYTSIYVMEKIFGAIIDGDIQNYQETKTAMNSMRANIMQELQSCRSVEEYIEKVNSFYTKN